MIVACIVIGSGTLVVALSALLKSKGDRAGASRKKDEQHKSTRYYVLYAVTLLIGCGMTAFGTWLTKRAGDEPSKKLNADTARMLREIKEEHARTLQAQKEQDERTVRELREERQAILVKLNSAKREDSKKITEEKIRVIQKDFAQWAENFATNLPTRRSEFAQLKVDFQKAQIENANKNLQRQVRVSGETYPALSWAIRVVQESVRAYVNKTGKQATIEPLDLPENFFEKTTESAIRFGGKAVWKLSVTAAGRPLIQPGIGPRRTPYLKINFVDFNGQQAGTFSLVPQPEAKKLSISYSASFQTPNTASISGDRDMSDYEDAITSALQPVIEAQLIRTEEQ